MCLSVAYGHVQWLDTLRKPNTASIQLIMLLDLEGPGKGCDHRLTRNNW